MGNESSQHLLDSPFVKKIHKSLTLAENEDHTTMSLVHEEFAERLAKAEGKISRNMNPFCPLDIEDGMNWVTCCFISPAMVVACPIYLCDKDGYLQKKCEALPIYKNQVKKQLISEALVIEKYNVSLLILETPNWKIGWAGITYIHSIQDLRSQQLVIINHPERVFVKQENAMIHIQQARPFKMPPNHRADNKFVVESPGLLGSLISKVVERKPYVVGIQISEEEVLFFSKDIFVNMQACTNDFMRKSNTQREIVELIDKENFQQSTLI